MHTRDEPQAKHAPGQITSLRVLAARMIWVFFGPVALALILWQIVACGDGWRTTLDVLFAAVLALMLLARWVEQRSGEATTLMGEPATPRHWRRGSAMLFVGAIAVWVLANVLGNHVLA
ncbi:MAG: hypothetical protein JXB13_06750 [Phycisphaerae bacterium]|nr:hypothetical protein [Phycisphaerae bacterium]